MLLALSISKHSCKFRKENAPIWQLKRRFDGPNHALYKSLCWFIGSQCKKQIPCFSSSLATPWCFGFFYSANQNLPSSPSCFDFMWWMTSSKVCLKQLPHLHNHRTFNKQEVLHRLNIGNHKERELYGSCQTTLSLLSLWNTHHTM